MTVVTEEKRKGYKARKIVFNLDAYSRVEAYELVPEARDRSPPCSCSTTTADTSPSERRR